MNDADARIEKLEIELVHLQRISEQLNEIVAAQSKELLQLTRTVERLLKQIGDLRKRPETVSPAPTLEEEQPPHY